MVWTNAFTMTSSDSKQQSVRVIQLQRLLALLITIILLNNIITTHAQIPADHLIPPPPPVQPAPSSQSSQAPSLPVPQALTHSRPFDYSKHIEAHPIPLQRDLSQSHLGTNDQTGLMTRIARWFGFSGSPQEQQLVAASFKHPAYSYPKPQEQFSNNGKANCNLCNKYPWIPMMPLSVQYPPVQQQYQAYQQAHWNQQHAQASKHAPAFLPIGQIQQTQQNQQQPSLKQRAVQFNFPQGSYSDISKLKSAAEFQAKGPAFAASSQASLSGNALPPIFNAQPFHTSTTSTTFVPFSEQQLPTTKPAYFAENIGAHSEFKPDQVIPTQIPPTVVASQDSSNVEIIKSQQLTDFVSSIEYPATFVQSHSFDVGLQTEMPTNHKPATETEEPTRTVNYQHELVQPHINNHVPASELLTKPSNLEGASKAESSTIVQAETTFAPNQQIYETYNQQQQLPSTTNAFKFDVYPSADNFPSASSHNNHNSFQLQTNEIFTTTEFPTETPPQTGDFIISERPYHTSSSTFEFAPSIQIQETNNNFRQQTKDRGTPKRLLDSPIQHLLNAPNGSPRPFTRDPSDLDYRLGFLSKTQQQHLNAAQIFVQPQTTETTSVSTVTSAPKFLVSSAQPTPTSTYGAIDASGQFAGMLPPVPLPVVTSAVQQIIVPYTTKNRPRPFESMHNRIESTTTGPFGSTFNRAHSPHNVDFHEQQESKVVISTATEIPTIPSAVSRTTTTKYITKVLAANLRDLLRSEQSLKNRSNSNLGVDLKKLQKNIDDWTEQEYTSLSHRPSTPTIRGRSKHIPAEYLTTTTPTPLTNLLKTTQIFDSAALSTSINNLESLRAPERGSKRFEYTPIEYNLITDSESFVTKATTTTTTTPTTTTMRPYKYTTPIYVRPLQTQPPPEVLWQKAKILISPDTKEKLYVVTPQPRFFPQRLATTSTPAPIPLFRRQKSPRFLVRPTPGSGSTNSTSNRTTAPYLSDPFGLLGLSAFVSAEPVEIIDGNSRVVTIVTPSAKPSTESDHHSTMSRSIRTDYVTIKRNHTKPTMSPSPR